MSDHRPDLPPSEPGPGAEFAHEREHVADGEWTRQAPHRYDVDTIDGAPCCPFDRGHPIHRQAELPAGPLVITEGELDVEPVGALDPSGGDRLVIGVDPALDRTTFVVGTVDGDGALTIHHEGAIEHAAPAVVTARGCEMCSYVDGGCSFCSGRSAIEVANERTDVAGVPVVDLSGVLEHQRRTLDEGGTE